MEIIFVLALLVGVLWGAEPIVAKRGMAGGGSSLQASITVVVVDSVLFLIALGLRQGGGAISNLSAPAAGLFIVAGILGTALGRLAVFVGVDRVGASVNNAVVSTRPFFAGILAVLFLGESVESSTIMGIVILVVGLAILALSRGGDLAGWKKRELLFPLGAAVAFGSGNVVRKFGLDSFSEVTVLQAVALNELGALAALSAFAVAAGRQDILQAPKQTYAYFAGSGLLTAFALLALFAALRMGRVVVVDPLAATAPLFTALFASLFLRDLERLTPRFIVGVVLTVAGVILIVSSPSILL